MSEHSLNTESSLLYKELRDTNVGNLSNDREKSRFKEIVVELEQLLDTRYACVITSWDAYYRITSEQSFYAADYFIYREGE